MAVSVRNRPEGYLLGTSASGKTIGPDTSAGNLAQVTYTAHGLIAGDVVYISSPIEDFNGFFFVRSVTTNAFKIATYNDDAGRFVCYNSTTEAIVTKTIASHGWNSIHLPIVYQLASTLWPTNSADTIRDITSVSDSNGYCNITAAGDIKATGSAAKLEFVKITGCTDENLNGIYQITSYTSDTSFVIDLAYSTVTASDLAGAGSIQYYYNNYVVKAKLYGGIYTGHPLDDLRPVELLATIDLVPDSSNVVKFSVAEYLKEQIKLRNNLLLQTLPNNIDFWTCFYITYAESYDDSNGTTLSTTTTSYTDDSTSFIGFAVNSMLDFKNVYSGAMSEYLGEDRKFLTRFTTPVLFNDTFYDISFLSEYKNVSLALRQRYYTDDVLQLTDNNVLTSTANREGLYRAIVDTNISCDYDEVDLTVMATGVTNVLNGDFGSGNLNEWSQSGSGNTWSFVTNGPRVTMTTGDTSKRFEQSYNFYEGITYSLNWTVIAGSTGVGEVFLVTAFISNDDYTKTQQVGQDSFNANGTTIEASSFTPNSNYTKLYFIVTTNAA